METILSCFLLFAFFFFANSTDLPKLKTIQSNFPDDYFCNKSMSKYVPGESSVVLQCGLQALKLVRIQAKKSGKPDEKELYKKLYNEFGSRVDSMTYLVSKYADSFSETGATFYQARRKCQACGGKLATKKEMDFYASVSQALVELNADENKEAVLNSLLGYWYDDSSSIEYTESTCSFIDEQSQPEESSRCVERRQFVCTFDQPIRNECIVETSVCTSPWNSDLEPEPVCGCPAYNTMRPTSYREARKRSMEGNWGREQPLKRNNSDGLSFDSGKSYLNMSVSERVIGGVEVTSGDKWPFFASIGACQSGCVPFGPTSKVCAVEIAEDRCELTKVEHKCGAVVLNQFWLLTAGHCFEGHQYSPGIFYAATGSDTIPTDGKFSGKRYAIKSIFVHPGYTESSFEMYNDIALVQIDNSSPLMSSEAEREKGLLYFEAGQTKRRAMTVCLPKEEAPKSDGHFGTLVGFGVTNAHSVTPSTQLREVALQFTNCSKYNYPYKEGLEICAGGEKANICGGDSGGPLLCDNPDGSFSICGVVSRSLSGTSSCTDSPGAFANVHHFKQWIKDTIEQNKI
ncbi:uncharacterized protein LOC142346046 isoform X1 [Convolutriloba macropyga]|uniref:uncharacterized protein LOC142346046 isoform X1 n=1 Tax=Convolutriloba macropyga TaxID=536237 RepID=UPI003F51C16D